MDPDQKPSDLNLQSFPKKDKSWFSSTMVKTALSYDVASWSEITPCNKICTPLVAYRFSGNVMTSISPLRT